MRKARKGGRRRRWTISGSTGLDHTYGGGVGGATIWLDPHVGGVPYGGVGGWGGGGGGNFSDTALMTSSSQFSE